jgi:type VI protein secretion system component VasF
MGQVAPTRKGELAKLSPSARTENELAALRGRIDADLASLRSRVASDADPRRLARRQPVAVFGALASVIAVLGITIASRVKSFRRSRTEKELDQVIERLGGRLDRLKGRTRKRFRESLRKEIGEVESGPRAKQMVWEAAAAALTSAATLLARRFASRVAADGELPEDQR